MIRRINDDKVEKMQFKIQKIMFNTKRHYLQTWRRIISNLEIRYNSQNVN